jgi:hypothetical protein
MRDAVPEITCRYCHEKVQVPDDLEQAHCVRCGRVLVLETKISSDPLRAKPAGQFSESVPRRQQGVPSEQPRFYADWDDFRSHSPALQRELVQLATRPLPTLRDLEARELPDGASELVAGFGQHLATLEKRGESVRAHTSTSVFIAAVAILFGLFLIGTGLREFNSDPNRHRAFESIIALGFGGCTLVAFGIVAARYAFFRTPAYGTTFWTYDEGILCQRGKRLAARRWEDVRDFQVVLEKGYPIYRLTVAEDMKTSFSRVQGPQAVEAMEFIEVKLSAAKFIPVLRKIYDGESVRFGAVELSRAGISGPRFFAQWAEIERVTSDAFHFFVSGRNHTSGWRIPYAEVSFPLVVLSVASVLIAEEESLSKVEG